jgi:ubiquinone/menaquinone biosynthesis C-methylase UbiE
MGHTDHERRRLSLQARFLNPLTDDFFHRAGIRPGMRVLDIGCGVGEVSLIAAQIVGPGGHVVGVDIDAPGLDAAREHASAEGLRQAVFEHADVMSYSPAEPFDAVVGRLILVHTDDPNAIIRHVVSLLRRGGLIAFQEADFTRSIPSSPVRPEWDAVVRGITGVLARVRPHAAVGTHLHRIFSDAGITHIQSRGECAVDGAPDSLMFDWIAETVRSLAAGMGEIELEGLAERLRAELAQVGGSAVAPMLFAVSGRKPGTEQTP